MRKTALEVSKAPVSRARMRPEYCGNVLLSWKDEMKVKGPPRAKNRYPGIYASKGSSAAKAKSKAPTVMDIAPVIPQTRGP